MRRVAVFIAAVLLASACGTGSGHRVVPVDDLDRIFEEEADALAYQPVKERDYFSAAGAEIIRSFAGRPDRLKELDVMAYEEHVGPHGFSYREVEDA